MNTYSVHDRRAIDERLALSSTTHFSVRFNELLSTANDRSTPVPRVTNRALGSTLARVKADVGTFLKRGTVGRRKGIIITG